MSGSLWNKNSWHWEERNHTQPAIVMLMDRFSAPLLDGPVEFRNFVFKGYANSSVRKGKLIIAFEFTATAEAVKDGSAIGNLSIDEFSQDELEPRVTVPPEISDLRKSVAAAVHRRLEIFAKDFRSQLEDETAKAADQERRAEESHKAQEAEKAKGEEKRKLLEGTKEKEKEKGAGISTEEVKASVWNANAYHWETKNAWSFVKEFLDRKLHDLGLTVHKISGEAEVSVRKGKKIVVFDLKLETDSFDVSDLTQEDLDGDFRLVWKSEERNIRKEQISDLLKTMVAEMKNL